jgi:hypothetical protein
LNVEGSQELKVEGLKVEGSQELKVEGLKVEGDAPSDATASLSNQSSNVQPATSTQPSPPHSTDESSVCILVIPKSDDPAVYIPGMRHLGIQTPQPICQKSKSRKLNAALT